MTAAPCSKQSVLCCRHSGPQGKVEPLTIIDDPADWKASDWEGRESEYIYRFTTEVCHLMRHSSEGQELGGGGGEEGRWQCRHDDYVRQQYVGPCNLTTQLRGQKV